MSLALLKHSLSYVDIGDLDSLSKSLKEIAREYYQQSCENLESSAASGRIEAQKYTLDQFPNGPGSLRQFWESGDEDRCALSEPDGDRLHYLEFPAAGLQRFRLPEHPGRN